jgi:hypothetical protein
MDIRNPGEVGTQLNAEFRDALGLVANDVSDATIFNGLALHLLRMGESGPDAIWRQAAESKQLLTEWKT